MGGDKKTKVRNVFFVERKGERKLMIDITSYIRDNIGRNHGELSFLKEKQKETFFRKFDQVCSDLNEGK